MEKLGKVLGEVSIPISIPRGSTPSSSSPTNSEAGPEPDTGICPHCKGAGWLRLEVPVGHPRFGKPYPCVCRTQAMDERNFDDLYKASNLDAFQDKVLQGFDPEVPGTGDAYRAAAEFATHPEDWLLVLGGYGSGKTHLAAGIANYVVTYHKMQVYFAIVPDLLDYLRAAYAPSSESTYDVRFEQIRSVYLLILDDLGVEQSTPWAVEKLYQIFNYRYNNRLPTVITSNCDLDDLDPRIRSRLCDRDLCRLVYMDAGDYRMRGIDARFAGRKQPFRGKPRKEGARR